MLHAKREKDDDCEERFIAKKIHGEERSIVKKDSLWRLCKPRSAKDPPTPSTEIDFGAFAFQAPISDVPTSVLA